MEFHMINDALPAPILQRVLEAIPAADDPTAWHGGSLSGEGENREGRGRKTWYGPPPLHSPIHDAIQLAYWTARDAVDPDDRRLLQLDLGYAGAFQMLPGTALSPHRDRTRGADPDHVRRYAGLLYLNEEPRGGNLELWDEGGPTTSIEPIWNRLVVFTMDPGWHAVRRVGLRRRLALAFNISERAVNARPRTKMEWWEDEVKRVMPWNGETT